MSDIAVWGFALATAAYVLFGIYLGLSWRGQRPGGLLILAVCASAFWSVTSWAQAAFVHSWLFYSAAVADVLRSAAWFAFLLALIEPIRRGRMAKLWTGALVTVVATLLALVVELLKLELPLSASVLVFSGYLSLAVFGLVLVEQLFRGLPVESRWGLKPLCLALAAAYIFDLYLYADGFLFGRLDSDVWSVRGVVFAMLIPLIALSAARNPSWTLRISVSRDVVFHSTALAISGLYLLLIAAAGYYVRYFGGSWGRALQMALLFGGLLLFGILLFSGAQRARLRVLLSKHLFPYRYDYRVEWQRFTQALSSAGDSLDLGQSVIKALSDQVESSGGALWLVDDAGVFRMHARLNHPVCEAKEQADGRFCQFLDQREWVINLEEMREQPDRYGELSVPHWLNELPDAWLVIPLKTQQGLIGFIVLNRPRTHFDINWEVLDLLKSAQRQAAGYLAQMQAAEALLESRKFDSFNRMSAFVVHDLKNLVAQLSLMLRNAQKHRDNPEFQADMIDTITHVEERMRALMTQLQEKTSVDPKRPVEIHQLISRAIATRKHQLPAVAFACNEGSALEVIAHPQRLERVIGHVVQNALDATEESGNVWVTVDALENGQILIKVHDDGKGMSNEFMRERLFKPFQSSKSAGMGIGVFETQQYLKELGGTIRYESAPGQGTCVSITLPRLQARDEDCPPNKDVMV